LFARFTIAASCARAAPGSPEEEQAFSKSNCHIQTPSLSQRSQSLNKPLLKNSFSTIFQGPGPGEAPFHFSRFVCWVHYCSKLCHPEEKQAFSKSNYQIQTPSLSQRSQSLIKPLLKNSFPQFSKALDHERVHFTLVGLFAGLTIAASCARAASGSPKEKQAFPKAIAKFKLQAFPKGANPLLNPY